MLNDMTPSITPHDMINIREIHTELIRKLKICLSASGVQGSYLAHLVASQFRHAVRLAFRGYSSALSVSITHVVCVGAKPEVSRVHARRIIAFMQNIYTGRNWRTCSHHPGYTMSAGHGFPVLEFPVTKNSGCRPRPALSDGAHLHLFPKVTLLLFGKLDLLTGIRHFVHSFFHSLFMTEVRARTTASTVAVLAYFTGGAFRLQEI